MEPLKSINARGRSFNWKVLFEGNVPYYLGGVFLTLLSIFVLLPKDLKQKLPFMRDGAGADHSSLAWRMKNEQDARRSGLRFLRKDRKPEESPMPQYADGSKGAGGSEDVNEYYKEGLSNEDLSEEELARRKKLEAEKMAQADGIDSVQGAGAMSGADGVDGEGGRGEEDTDADATGYAGKLEGGLSAWKSGGNSSISGTPGGGAPALTRNPGQGGGPLDSKGRMVGGQSAGARTANSLQLAKAGARGSSVRGALGFSANDGGAGLGFSANRNADASETTPGSSTPGGTGAPIGGGGMDGPQEGGPGTGTGIGGGITPPSIGASGPAQDDDVILDAGDKEDRWGKCSEIFTSFDSKIAAEEARIATCKKMQSTGKKGGMVEVMDMACYNAVMSRIADLRAGRDEAVASCNNE